MAERTPRFLFQNGFTLEGTSLSASAELVDHGVEHLRNTALGADWRTPFGWNVVRDFNDKQVWMEDAYIRVAQVPPGNYAAGADLATALTAAMNAALLYPGWDTTNLRLWLRSDWTDLYGDEPTSGAALGAKVDPVGADTGGTGWASQRYLQGLGARPYVYQGTLGSRPTYLTGRQNGLPCVTFDGGDSGELRYGAGPTGLALSQMLAASTGVHTGFAVLKSDSTGGATQRVLHSTSSAGLTLDWNGGNFRYKVTDGGGAKQVTKAGTQNAFHVITFGYDGTNVFLGVDDTRAASLATLACGSLTGALLAEFLTLGGSAAAFFKGDLAEILLYQANIGEAARKHVETQLVGKWGGVTLPYADSWTNAYAVTYDVSTGKFTVSRSSGAGAVTMFNLSNLGSMPGGGDSDASLADESLQRDLGFSDPSGTYSGAAIVGDFPVWQGSAQAQADLGPASCDVRIIPTVNDRIKWQLGPSYFGVAELSGARDTTISGLLLRVQNQLNASILPASGVSNCTTWSWDVATSKVVVLNTSGLQLTLEVEPAAADLLPTLGITSTLVIGAGLTGTAAAELWGWNPTQAGALVGHNTVGFVELAATDFAIRGQGAWTGTAGGFKHRNGRNSSKLTVYGTARAMVAMAAAPVGRRFLRVTVHDEGNTDAFVSIPVIFCGPYLQPSRSFRQAYQVGRAPFDAAERTEYGGLVGEKRAAGYTFRGTLYRVDQTSRDALEEMFDAVGLVVPFVFCEDPQGGRRAYDWTRYVNFVAPPRSAQAVGDGDPADRWEIEIEVQENLP